MKDKPEPINPLPLVPSVDAPPPSFTKDDVLELLSHAASAPLQGIPHARKIDALLQKFATWAEYQLKDA